MRRVVFCVFAVVLAAALIPTAALAKGASEAAIVGPGLSEPIVLSASGGSETSGELGNIAMSAGFFPAVFAQTPDPMLDERPAGPLGPKYTVTYVMPGPDNQRSELVQDIYPYAEPDPVTYTEPGQRYWTTEQTRGGWYVATFEPLKEQLVAAGLPTTAPTVGGADGDGFPWVVVGVIAAIAALIGAAAFGAFHGRRRPDTAAA
jgi:hypothetical protein